MKPQLHTFLCLTLILCLLIMSPSTSTAQLQISIDSIASQMGEQVAVCSRVYGIHGTKGVKPVTFLNLGADYPNQKLTIVIFHKDAVNFTFVPSDHYKNQNVCVNGELSLYKERPQIIIRNEAQIVNK